MGQSIAMYGILELEISIAAINCSYTYVHAYH